MADNQILVKFKPQGHKELINAINKLTLSQTALEKGVKAYEKQLKRLNLQQGKYNQTTLGGVRNNRIMGGSIATLRSAMLLYSFAVGAAITKIVNLTKEQAKLNNLADGFNNLSKEAGLSIGSLENLRKATNNTMSDMELLTQANNALILGVAENTSQMAFMFDAAQRLGRALGRDTATSVESLVTGVGRQSRLMLDNIGIIVKAEEAYEAYAKSLKTTADKLTDAEKKAAFMEATMKGVSEGIAKLGKETGNLQDDIQTLGSFFDNLTASMVSYFGLTDNIKTVTEFYANHAKQLSAVDDEQIEINKRFKEQQDEIKKTESLLSSFNGEEERLKLAIQENSKEMTGFKKKNLPEEFKKLRDRNKELNEQLDDVQSSTGEFAQRVSELESELTQMKSELVESIEKFKETRQVIIDVNHQLMLMGGTVVPRASDGVREMSSAWDQYLEKVPEVTIANQNLQASVLDVILSYDTLNEKVIPNLSKLTGAYDQALGSIEANMIAMDEKAKLEELDAANSIKNEERRRQKIDLINVRYERKAEERAKKLRAWKVASAISNTALGITQTLADPTIKPSFLKFPIMAMQAIAGAAQIATIKGEKFEQGGMVGGKRHSQGGTLIEAEQGEFVMSRNAVNAIGVENLNRMNRGGGGAVNITFTGNVMSQDFIENEAIPQIKDAIRRGADIGVS